MGASAFLKSVDFRAFEINVKTITPTQNLYQSGHAIWCGRSATQLMGSLLPDQKSKEGGELMYAIWGFILQNWLEWLFAAITFILGCLYRDVRKRLGEEQRKSTAIAGGVQSLLRESIVQNYNKYQDRECCPIYAKESMKKVYESYHGLGGNDVATKLYNTLLAMPEEPKEREG